MESGSLYTIEIRRSVNITSKVIKMISSKKAQRISIELFYYFIFKGKILKKKLVFILKIQKMNTLSGVDHY